MDGLVEHTVRSKSLLERLREALAAPNWVEQPTLASEMVLLQFVQMVQGHFAEHVAIPTVSHVRQIITELLNAFMLSLRHPACWKWAIHLHHEARKVDQSSRPQLIGMVWPVKCCCVHALYGI